LLLGPVTTRSSKNVAREKGNGRKGEREERREKREEGEKREERRRGEERREKRSTFYNLLFIPVATRSSKNVATSSAHASGASIGKKWLPATVTNLPDLVFATRSA
jgi:hypothetical protein